MSVSPDNIRDILESAVEEHEPSADSTPLETSAPQETEAEATARVERARDEAGRFTKAERDAQAAATPPVEPAKTRPPRPSSWKKDFEGKWNEIYDSDPNFAQYLLDREGQFAQGVSTYKAEADQARALADRARAFQAIMEPHAPRFQQYGADPQEYIGRLLKMDEILATGSLEQKQAMLLSIARAVGLTDEPAPQNQASYVPPELVQTVYGLRSELDAIKQANERAEQTRRASEVDSFAADHPYLDDLAEPMAQLLETGFATSMEDAYRKALRLDDEIFQKYQAEQQQGSEAERQRKAKETAARARSAAVSPRSSTPTGSVATASAQGSDIRSILESTTNSVLAGGGRI